MPPKLVVYRISAKYPPYNVGETVGRDPDKAATQHLIQLGVLVPADAKPSEPKPVAPLTGLENLTVAELEEYADQEGYDLAGAKTKKEKIDKILEGHERFPVSE